MNKKVLVSVLMFSVLFLVIGLGGCKKDTPDTSGKKPEEPKTPKDALDDLESKDPELAAIVAKMFEEAEKKAQKTCPIMGKGINRDIFVEYKGKRVYFCCPECKDKFDDDPDKYLPKLPQFQE